MDGRGWIAVYPAILALLHGCVTHYIDQKEVPKPHRQLLARIGFIVPPFMIAIQHFASNSEPVAQGIVPAFLLALGAAFAEYWCAATGCCSAAKQ
jgi:hypothetical protein